MSLAPIDSGANRLVKVQNSFGKKSLRTWMADKPVNRSSASESSSKTYSEARHIQRWRIFVGKRKPVKFFVSL